MSLLEDEEESWRLLLEIAEREGEFEMFVKIGERVVNLANVTQIVPGMNESGTYIRIEFTGEDSYRLYTGNPGYRELQTWMEEQPMLLGDEK
jgi:hypothetical protein